MEPEAHWHLSAFDEVLQLKPPREVPLEEVIAAIERCADAVADDWLRRGSETVADLGYAWILEQSRFFSVRLPDGERWGFRDLRLFCLAWESVPRICVVAVDADGRRRIEEDFFGLLARLEDACRLHAEGGP